ncbi:MAG: hypothetical protein WBW56_03780, partial [Syntrophobacteraceae bacterium]
RELGARGDGPALHGASPQRHTEPIRGLLLVFLCALCASVVEYLGYPWCVFGFSLLPAPCFTLPASLLTVHCFLLSPVIAENLIQKCQFNQFVVRSAPAFALYLQELQSGSILETEIMRCTILVLW